MKVYNTSRILTSNLKGLVQFVVARCESSVMAHLVVEDAPQRYKNMEGYSWQQKGDDPTAPSRVCIWMPRQEEYPRTVPFHPAVPALTFRSQDEEFLAVLAHELRHVDQYWNEEPYTQGFDFEADAERFAHEILTEYRKDQPANLIHFRAKGYNNGKRNGKARSNRGNHRAAA